MAVTARRFARELNQLIYDYYPGKSVFVSVDGVAPTAKFFTQRLSRESALEKFIRRGLLDLHHPDGPGATGLKSEHLISVGLTPGTRLMDHVDEWAHYSVCRYLLLPGKKRFSKPGLKAYVSSSRVAGEGEHKIFQHLIQHQQTMRGETSVIVSSDSDMYLQLMMAQLPHVYFLNNTEIGGTPLGYVSLKPFLDAIKDVLAKQGIQQANPTRVMRDLGFLSLLVGNDYLPKLRGVSIRSLWQAYLKELKQRPNRSEYLYLETKVGPTMNYIMLKTILERVKKSLPPSSIADLMNEYDEDLSELESEEEEGQADVADELDADNDGDQTAEILIPEPKALESISPIREFVCDRMKREKLRLKSDAVHYMKGLFWLSDLMKNGHPPHWDFEYRPRAAPSLLDVLDFLGSEPSYMALNSQLGLPLQSNGSTPVVSRLVPALLVPYVYPAQEFVPTDLKSSAADLSDALIETLKSVEDGRLKKEASAVYEVANRLHFKQLMSKMSVSSESEDVPVSEENVTKHFISHNLVCWRVGWKERDQTNTSIEGQPKILPWTVDSFYLVPKPSDVILPVLVFDETGSEAPWTVIHKDQQHSLTCEFLEH